MESAIFRRHIDLRRTRDEGSLSQLVAQQMRYINQEVAEYIAENCPADAYQLLQIRRDVHELPNRLGHEVRVTLEVGAVTERPLAYVTVSTDAEAAVGRTWLEMTGESLPFDDYQAKPRKPTISETLPTKRHILIDKQHQPA